MKLLYTVIDLYRDITCTYDIESPLCLHINCIFDISILMDCDYVCRKETIKQTSFKNFVTMKRSNKDILDDNSLLPLFLSYTRITYHQK